MTEAQKVKFLRAEGWQIGGSILVTGKKFTLNEKSMLDPAKGDIYGHGLLDLCFHIASRRKAAREVRRLKAAGAEFSEWVMSAGGDPIKCWTIGSRFIGYTRDQAIAFLDRKADR